MDSQDRLRCRGQGRKRLPSLPLLAGFLTLAVGFLMPPATAAPLGDALELIDQLESDRRELLAHADSLGSLLAATDGASSPEAARLLREAGELEEEAREIELQILLTRQRCRSLASRELESLQGSTDPEKRQRESELLVLLERKLAADWGGEWVLVEPDSLDGYETLLDKRAYLADLQDRFTAWLGNLDRRMERERREEALRTASDRFAEESRFLDEGGRVGSDETVMLRGLPGDEPPEGTARIRPSGGGVHDPDDVGSLLPVDDASDGSGSADLATTHARLERDLSRVAATLLATEELLGRFEALQP